MFSWKNIRVNALALSKRWIFSIHEETVAQIFAHEQLACFGVDSNMIGTFEFRALKSFGKNG